MIDAATARQRARTVNGEKAERECSLIETAILKAVDAGDMTCHIYFKPHPAVIRKYEKLGYTFGEASYHRHEVSMPIMWEV